ncbi:uncharacterized protein LOC135838061 [Planococcus citri]|uniref:uncharacterized protein LOC135838061 n=1 Tax=Planococcus citri TaxID=170843 RepID=UPI0031F7346F
MIKRVIVLFVFSLIIDYCEGDDSNLADVFDARVSNFPEHLRPELNKLKQEMVALVARVRTLLAQKRKAKRRLRRLREHECYQVELEYGGFQCAISDGRRSQLRFFTDVKKFVTSPLFLRKEYFKELYAKGHDDFFKRIVKRLTQFPEGGNDFKKAVSNAQNIWRFISFKKSSIARNIRSLLNDESYDLHVVAFSATLEGSYHLFNRYMHPRPNDRTNVETSAVREYCAARIAHIPVSFREFLLIHRNHWNYTPEDFYYLNVLRRCLDPADPLLSKVDLTNEYNQTFIMPQLDPRYGCPYPVWSL